MKKRMIMWEKSLFDALWCAAMILFVCAANVTAQDNVQRPPGSVVRKGLLAPQFVVARADTPCSASDKMEVTGLSFSPADSSVLLSGMELTFKMTIKNKCPSGTTPLSDVGWAIKVDGDTRWRGTVTKLQPGESREVTGNWNAVKGSHRIVGSVQEDTGNSIEDTGIVRNNHRSLDIRVTAVLKPVIVLYGTISYVGHSFKLPFTICNIRQDTSYDVTSNPASYGVYTWVTPSDLAPGAFFSNGQTAIPPCPSNLPSRMAAQPGTPMGPGLGNGLAGNRPPCGASARYTLNVEAERDGETSTANKSFDVKAVLSECPPKPSDLPKPSDIPKPSAPPKP